jgi:hypothetical protein
MRERLSCDQIRPGLGDLLKRAPNIGSDITLSVTNPLGINSDWPKSQSRKATFRYLNGAKSIDVRHRRSHLHTLTLVD